MKCSTLVLATIAILFSMLSCKTKYEKYKVPSEIVVLIEDSLLMPEPKMTPIGNAETTADQICRTYRVEWAAGDKTAILLDPSKDVIFPGAVIQSESLETGKFQPVIGQRLPIVISTDLPNVRILKDTIKDVKLSNVTQAIKNILQSKEEGVQPAEYTLTVRDIKSEEDFNLKVLANFSYPGGSVKSGFDFRDGNKKSRFFVDFTQIFYSMSVDELGPDEFFESEPETPIGKSPVYVSSVKYGRRIILTIESDSLYTGKRGQIEAEFSGISTSGKGSATAILSKMFQEKSIKFLVVGGEPMANFKLIEDQASLAEVLRVNSVWDNKKNPGSPMAYTLRNAYDNSVFKVAQAGNYVVRECITNPTDTYMFTPTNMQLGPFIGRHIGGDRDFNGHGPHVTYSFIFFNENNEIFVSITASFLEWDGGNPKKDYTQCVISEKVKLGVVPSNYKVLGITSNLPTVEGSYTDNSHEADGKAYPPEQDFIINWTMIGDTGNNDMGVTGIYSIRLKPFSLNVKKL